MTSDVERCDIAQAREAPEVIGVRVRHQGEAQIAWLSTDRLYTPEDRRGVSYETGVNEE
jgi:hypothetical protein